MYKKFLIVCVLILSVLILSGCGYDAIIVKGAKSEKEVISYVKKEIYSETKENVDVKIVSKERAEICTDTIDTCIHYQKVWGGYTYSFEITNDKYTDLVATGTYTDGYTIYDESFDDGKIVVTEEFSTDYIERRTIHLMKSEFSKELSSRFDKYYVYSDVTEKDCIDVFISSTDYYKINELLLRFKDIVIKNRDLLYVTYNVFIYKDLESFTNDGFDKCFTNDECAGESYGGDIISEYSDKEVKRIGFSEGFDYNLFVSNGASNATTDDEYVDFNSFDYLVFWYYAEPNSFVGANTDNVQLFGVK